jgi:hypothetical protein
MQTREEILGENAALRGENATLKDQLGAALARIAELEARLGMNSRNSSKPPSSDPPNVAARPKRKPSGRRRGGQPGHKGTTRPLLPPEQVDSIIDLKPEKCDRCGRALAGDDPKPTRRQVIDVPPVKPDVTEYRRHTLQCECGARTTAPLPPGVTESAFSPRIKAMSAMCTGVYRLSRRVADGLMEDFFGVDMSLGSVSACEQTVSEAVAAPVAEARKYVESAPVAHAGVEPTNNAAERALRPAVLWRKGSFGSASERGSRFVERMLTVAATCRQQGRSVLEYLVAAVEATARGETAPSLLPSRSLEPPRRG